MSHEQLTVGSLFAGIGGFDLGLERAGMRVIWQSEIDPYASAVLRRHWPAVPNLGDIRDISPSSFDALADATGSDAGSGAGFIEGPQPANWQPTQFLPNPSGRSGATEARRNYWPDVLCGGFPCQDISNAGKRAGINGERSGLWSEFARLIGELRPRYAIMENVAALLGRGIERVLGDLAALGYDAEWHCIPASAVGAPHRRDRVWIVAYPERRRLPGRNEQFTEPGTIIPAAFGWHRGGREFREAWWTEPNVGRVAHGISSAMDRLRCIGNAIVPQIAEIIGRAIIEADR